MVIIGQMYVRGEGSTMNRKNVRPICGKPMVYWALKNALDAGFMDDIFVFTEDEQVARVTESLGCKVVKRPREMLYYNGGFARPDEWGTYLKNEITEKMGAPVDIRVSLNCNVCLLTGETLRRMYVKLMEDEVALHVWPVVEVEPHLYMENPNTGHLFPVWDAPGLDRQKFPKLYRRIGVAVYHEVRAQSSYCAKDLFHEISFEESLDIHSTEDLFIAEAFLKRRLDSEKISGEDT
jgi:CMP-N-acetylneuraminic acid synthetase